MFMSLSCATVETAASRFHQPVESQNQFIFKEAIDARIFQF